MAGELVLVDTSYWVEFFNRPDSEEASRVAGLVRSDRAALAGVVMAELLQGARTDEELSELQDALTAVEWVPATPDVYARAGALDFSLRRRGVTVPITDCVIATAETFGGCVLTLDRHFQSLADVAEISVLPG